MKTLIAALNATWAKVRAFVEGRMPGGRWAITLLRTITWPGWIAIVMLIVMTILTMFGHWVETRLSAMGIAMLLVWSLLWVLGRSRLQVNMKLEANRIVVGSQGVASIEVTNLAAVSARPIVLQIPVGEAKASFPLPRIRSKQTHSEAFIIPGRKRGVVKLGPVTSVRGDALGLMQRTQTWTDELELYIHPTTVFVPISSIGILKDIEGASTETITSSDVSFHALREYNAGDDRRSIHWRTTARVGKLMVRQFEETRRAHLLCMLSINQADYASADEFELAISVVASLAVQTIRDGKQVSVVTQAGLLSATSAQSLLDQLTELQSMPPKTGVGTLSSIPLFELAQSGVIRVPQASVATIVCGTGAHAATLKAARKHVPLDMRTFGFRCHDAGNHEDLARSTRQTTDDMALFNILTLQDLPLLIRGVEV